MKLIMNKYIIGYDEYKSEDDKISSSAICIMKNGIFIECTTNRFKIRIYLFLAKLFKVKINQEIR